ncbi:hypothetical protein EVAR_6104_1 [Eumeta japonica]|uniref:Uncharacterized protein n=1 Tax=Eumeta variegata TaxID=151549 RepID=A0A4C1TE74_EUMVA|nr:hypothetical protein EVAR_6104_1 [Eumeta japonica]
MDKHVANIHIIDTFYSRAPFLGSYPLSKAYGPKKRRTGIVAFPLFRGHLHGSHLQRPGKISARRALNSNNSFNRIPIIVEWERDARHSAASRSVTHRYVTERYTFQSGSPSRKNETCTCQVLSHRFNPFQRRAESSFLRQWDAADQRSWDSTGGRLGHGLRLGPDTV